MPLLLFVIGLALLIAGAELLVRGASSLAKALGISPLIIGLTVVAFGTSAPEMAVCIDAALHGQGGIAVGNVVGSSIFNVLFILGISALICPLVVSKQLVRFDVPLLIVVSVIAYGMAWDGQFGFADGLVLFGGQLLYTSFLVYHGRKSRTVSIPVGQLPEEPRTAKPIVNLALVVSGLVMLIAGSHWLVDGAVTFARLLDVEEVVIGLTIVAAGTSLPEVVTSIVASVRGERDIAVGNVVGSNLFNLLGALGLTALIAPEPVIVGDSVVSFDLPLMIAVTFACLPIFFTGGRISRWEGALLFACYLCYTAFILLAAVRHEALPVFRVALLYFAVPLTVLTLVVTTVQYLRRIRQQPNDHTPGR